MILIERYKKQLATVVLLATTAGLLPPVSVNAIINTSSGTGITSDPTGSIIETADSDTTNTIITATEHSTINTNLMTAINYLQELHVSALGGIEFNGGATEITTPDGGTAHTGTEQTYVESDDGNYVQLQKLLLGNGESQTTTEGFLATLVSLSSQLGTLNSTISGMTPETGTGHTYQAKLKELIQYIDAVAVHIGMKEELDTLVTSIGVEDGGIAPVKLTEESGSGTGRFATTAIHVSENEGADIPKDKFWVTENIYNDLKTELGNASAIAQKVHPKGIFAAETLSNTTIHGAYKIAGPTNDGSDDIDFDPVHHTTDTVQKVTIATDGTMTSVNYDAPTATDSDYSDLTELTEALEALTTAYEDFIDADSGEGFYAEQVKLGEVEIKSALAMGGFPITDSGTTKELSVILTDLKEKIDAKTSDNLLFEADTNDETVDGAKLADENQIFLYTRKATAAEVGGDVVEGDFLLVPDNTTIEADTIIVTTKDKAEDITLYVNPADSAVASTDYLQLSDIQEEDNYFITPAVKEKPTHIGNWTPGGPQGGLDETEGLYITMAEASAHILAVNDLITDYLDYDGKNESLSALSGDDLKTEVDAALTNSALENKVAEITTEIDTVSDLFKEGEKDGKDKAQLDLVKLMIHLGFATVTAGTDSDPDTISFDKSTSEFKTSTESGVIFTDGATLRSASSGEFDYENHKDTTDLSDFADPAGDSTNTNIRKYHNVSILSGYDLPATDSENSDAAVTWVTPEVHDALYDAAETVYDFIMEYTDATGNITDKETYDAKTLSDLEDQAETLSKAIEDYNDEVKEGRTDTLIEKFKPLFTAVHGVSDTTTPGSADDKGAADYLTLAEEGSAPRSLVDPSLTLSDEGIFAITSEKTDDAAEIKKLMSNHLIGDTPAVAATHWVTPEEVDALDTPLISATKLFTLLGNIIDYTNPAAPTIKDFTDDDADITNGNPNILAETHKTELINFATFFSGEGEDDDTSATKYDIEEISKDLSGELTKFVKATEKTVLDPANYVDLRNPLRTAVWGNPDPSHTSTGADTSSSESPTNPATASARALVKTIKPVGSTETIVYLDPTRSLTANTAGTGPLVVSQDGGATYVEYDPNTKKLANKGLIDHTSSTEWITQETLDAYNTAIEAAEKVLKDSAPSVKKSGDTTATKIEEAQLVNLIANGGTPETYIEVKFEDSFLAAIKADPDYLTKEADKLIAVTTGATDVFKAAFQTGTSEDVTTALSALSEFKTTYYGTANAGNGTPNLADDGYVGASTTTAGTGILADFYKTTDGYFPINVHQSEDGFLNIKDEFINETVVDEAGTAIINYATESEIETISDALLVVDGILAKGDAAILAELAKTPGYLDGIKTTLNSAIQTFETAKAKTSKSVAYQAAFDILSTKIATADLNTSLAAVTGSAAPASTVSVTDGDLSLDPAGAIKESEDGKTNKADKADLIDNDLWINPAMLTTLQTAVKGIYDIVQEASTNLTSSKAKAHRKAYVEKLQDGGVDGYFNTLTQSVDLDSAISGFVVKTYEAPDNTKVGDYVTELKTVLYGDSGAVGGTGVELDSGITKLDSGADALSLAILTEITAGGQTLPASIKFVKTDYANEILDMFTKVEEANEDTTILDELAESVYDLTVKIPEKTGTLAITETSPEVALHDLYLEAKALLIKNGKDVLADDVNGDKTATSAYWLKTAQIKEIKEAIADAETLFDEQFASDSKFTNDVAKLKAEFEKVNKYKPKKGTLGSSAAVKLEEAKVALLEMINSGANLIGKHYLDTGVENPNTSIDPDTIVVASKLLGTDVLSTRKWTTTLEINKLTPAITKALTSYNSGKAKEADYTKAKTTLEAVINTFNTNAKAGVKEEYDKYVKSLSVYVDVMTNGNDGYTTGNFANDKPIPAISEIVKATNGAATSPSKYWAKAADISVIEGINNVATDILDTRANILEGKITLTLEKLIEEYKKVSVAFEKFYSRKIDGTVLATSGQMQAGTEGLASAEIINAINAVKTEISNFLFVGAASNSITKPEHFKLNNFDPESIPDNLPNTILVSAIADGADIPGTAAGANWVPVTLVNNYANAVDSAQLALDAYKAAAEKGGTIAESILTALDTNIKAIESAKIALDKSKKLIEAGSISPEAAALQAAQTKLIAALVEANALIGKVYAPSDDKIDGTSTGMDANTGLEVSDTSIKLIGESISGYGTEFEEGENWVPTANFEAFERAINSAIAAKNSTTATADTLTNANKNLTAAAERIIATAKVKGEGTKGEFEDKKDELTGLIRKANLMRYGASSADDLTEYEEYWGAPIGKTTGDQAIAYPLMLSNRNGTDVSNQAYWASAIAYNKFINAITVAEKVIADPVSNIKHIEAQIKSLGDNRIGAINSILAYGKPRKGVAKTDMAELVVVKNALKIEINKAQALLDNTAQSDKEGRDITEGTPWISKNAKGFDGTTDSGVSPVSYLTGAITTAQSAYDTKTSKDDLNSAKTAITDAITGFMKAFSNQDLKDVEGTTPNIFGGDRSGSNTLGVDGSKNAIAAAKVIFKGRYDELKAEFDKIKALDLVSTADDHHDTPGTKYTAEQAAEKNKPLIDALAQGTKYADNTDPVGGAKTAYNTMIEAFETALKVHNKEEIPTVDELTKGVTDPTLIADAGALGVLNQAYGDFDKPENVFTVGGATGTTDSEYKPMADAIIKLLGTDKPLVLPYNASLTTTDNTFDLGTNSAIEDNTTLTTYLQNLLIEVINNPALTVEVTGGTGVAADLTAKKNENYTGFKVEIQTKSDNNLVYTIGLADDITGVEPSSEATLYVEIGEQKSTNAGTKLEVLRAASIIANKSALSVPFTSGDTYADVQTDVVAELTKALTEANIIVNTDPAQGIVITAAFEDGKTGGDTSVENEAINFTVSLETNTTFAPEALAMSMTDIEAKVDETLTASSYKVTFKDAFKVTPKTITAEQADTAAVEKAQAAINDAGNIAAIKAIDMKKAYTQASVGQAILDNVTKVLKNTTGIDGVKAEITAADDAYTGATYTFKIKVSKGNASAESANDIELSGLKEATVQTVSIGSEVIVLDEFEEIDFDYDNYYDYNNEYEFDYEYESEFNEEYVSEPDDYYYEDTMYLDDYYYDDSNSFDNGFEDDFYFEEPEIFDFDEMPEFEEELILKQSVFEKIASLFSRFRKQ
ncbi:MAG: hypothetical protein ATN31_09920 [Candidatus Epulonipiscioides saccharophilum]|nr:MAG: hypothetical protein ATN31_09920 [Epulopiscium sp. AS2M-Bin001]